MSYSLTESIVYFIIITIGYIVLKFVITPSLTSDKEKAASGKKYGYILALAYMFLTLIGQTVINFSNAKQICQNSSQSFFNILLYTFLPNFFILGSIILLVAVIPGWLSPFSNTVGYALVTLMGLSRYFNELLRPNDGTGGNKILTKIYSDKSIIINEMTASNYEEFMKGLAKGGKTLIQNYNTKKMANGKVPYNEIFRLINLKNIIAEGIWYLLAGCLAISIASNAVLNIQCEYTPKQMADMHAKIKAQQAKMHADSEKNPPQLYSKHT